MKEYRTDEQFEDIIYSMVNGNWTKAAEKCVEYGFYAHDLLEKCENEEALSPYETSVNVADICILVEMAAERRYK